MTNNKISAASKLLDSGVAPKDITHDLGVLMPTLYRWLSASERSQLSARLMPTQTRLVLCTPRTISGVVFFLRRGPSTLNPLTNHMLRHKLQTCISFGHSAENVFLTTLQRTRSLIDLDISDYATEEAYWADTVMREPYKH